MITSRHLLVAVLAAVIALPAMADKRFLQGKVVYVDKRDQETPAKGVDVTIEQTGNSDTTKAAGLFRIFLPSAFLPGDTVTLQVASKDWRIWHPLAGEVNIPANPAKKLVTVKLLPGGAKRFLSEAGIEKMLADAAKKSKEQVKPEGRPADINLGRYIEEWASRYGFTPERVKAEVDQWIAKVEAGRSDLHKLALAEFAKNNFDKASELAAESGAYNENKLREAEQEAERRRADAIRDYRLAGDGQYNSYRFDRALEFYRRALGVSSKGRSAVTWAAIQFDVARAGIELGTRVEGGAAQKHLREAVQASRAALEIRTRDNLPQDWAMTQNNLGIALQQQGIRSPGEEGRALLAQAVSAYRAALEIYTRDNLPQQWAMTQNNLGVALQDQGIRSPGEEGRALLAQAVAAYRAALEIRTRDNLPQDWATTQNNLGVALQDQGIRSPGEEGRALLAQAVAAYRAALEIYTRDNLPQQWATTQNNLGIALQEQGIRSLGEEGRALLAQAVAAYRAALEIRTRDNLPQHWATTQNNLGIALQEQGIRSPGEEGRALLAQAVSAYRAALEIYTRDNLPQDWAMTQNNLGVALQDQGIRSPGEEGRALLAQAASAYEAVLDFEPRDTGVSARLESVYHDWLYEFDGPSL